MQHLPGRTHENADKRIRERQACGGPENAEKRRRAECIFERFTDSVSPARTEVCGNNRLRCLTHAVGAALRKGADIDDDSIYRKGVCAEVKHNLAVKQNRQNAHCHINKKGRKASYADFTQLCKKPGGSDQPQRIFFIKKWDSITAKEMAEPIAVANPAP